jgi:hypothetical protein
MRCIECFFENQSGAHRCRICGATLPDEAEPAASETLLHEATDRGGFFSFGTLITPACIQVAYVIGAAVITLAGLLMVALVLMGIASEYTDTSRDALLIGGLTLLGIGNLLWRMLCEMVMLVFRIHEVLVDLNDKARALIGLFATRKGT